LPFTLFYILNHDRTAARLIASSGVESQSAAFENLITINSSLWPVAEVINSGQTIEVHNLSEVFGSINCRPYPESIEKAIIIPVNTPGADRPSAFFIAGVSVRLALSWIL
jgi:hypothetical protein